MVSPEEVGRTVLVAILVVVILSYLWPHMPTIGAFSDVTWQLEAVAAVILGFIVIGPGRVAYDLIVDSGF